MRGGELRGGGQRPIGQRCDGPDAFLAASRDVQTVVRDEAGHLVVQRRRGREEVFAIGRLVYAAVELTRAPPASVG
ncbi:hypothetical protein ATY41_11370 [Leifsonia xyli subsp. xyli]|uniref:Uncharacterized protein n=1 Tax=Leifsonia xyli subsp. xyli TaxID=59736 RepID=A0A1E2SJV1_LEIXY|nr:hypothetical protein ATY41_11370 [Leifsonia xyli subsp. xyli]